MSFLNCPLGILKIVEDNGYIVEISLVERIVNGTETKLTKECKKQLEEYFNKKRKTFDLPLKLNGTDFQKRAWNALLNIPYGKTKSYKEIALEINCDKGFRAVGNANNKNPIMVVVPCHRVIGSDNKLVGYASGINHKKFLLDLEKSML